MSPPCKHCGHPEEYHRALWIGTLGKCLCRCQKYEPMEEKPRMNKFEVKLNDGKVAIFGACHSIECDGHLVMIYGSERQFVANWPLSMVREIGAVA